MMVHLDITYKLNGNMKIRLRNEFRVKELSDNVFRYRLRYSYAYETNYLIIIIHLFKMKFS